VAISVVVSAIFGMTVIGLLFWLRGRNQSPPESGIEGVPSPVATGTTAKTPVVPPPTATAAQVAPPVVDIPPVGDSAEPEAPGPKTTSDDSKSSAASKAGATASAKSGKTSSGSKTGGTTKTTTPSTGKTGGGQVGGKAPKGCDSPFYVDANGIKHIKPECM
jgi:hypothetical protein